MRERGASGDKVKRVGVAICGAALAGLLQFGQAGAATPAAAPRWGYVFDAAQTQAHYTATDAADSAGSKVTVTRLGAGRYVVYFHDLLSGGADGGTVDVTANDTPGYCKIESWGPSGMSLAVSVNCYQADGTPADEEFFVTFADPGSNHPPNLTYVWANKPAQPSYTPMTRYQYNSGGGTDIINEIGTGDYHVKAPDIGLDAGTVKVTAYGPGTATSCSVQDWGGTPRLDTYIQCQDPSGDLVNAKFTMTWVNHSSLLGIKGRKWGYVWGDDSTSTSYTPDTTYQGNSSGATNTVTKVGAGYWQVDMPNIGGAGGVVQVSAYGDSPDHCNSGGFTEVGSTEEVEVICFDPSGNFADTQYTVQYER